MAQHTTTYTYCDREDEGVEVDATDNIGFSLGSDDYELDVCAQHSAYYRGILNEMAVAGRPRPGNRQHSPGRDRRRKNDRVKSSDIRAWAVQQAIEISPKGRIPETIVLRYHAEHDNPELAEAV